jgi:hypothetical protein
VHKTTAELLRQLMQARGLPVPATAPAAASVAATAQP